MATRGPRDRFLATTGDVMRWLRRDRSCWFRMRPRGEPVGDGRGKAAPFTARLPIIGPQTRYALKGAVKGGSHAAFCNRSWLDGISNLCATPRRPDLARAEGGDREAEV